MRLPFPTFFLHSRLGKEDFANLTGDAEPDGVHALCTFFFEDQDRTHLQQTSVSIKATTVPAALFARPKPNTRSRSCPSLPPPSDRGRPTSCVVLPAQLLISRLPLPLRTQDRSGGSAARTPLRCSARKMRFDGGESKRGVTIDGPMGRSKYRGTQGITSMDVVKAEADALKQSNEAPS